METQLVDADYIKHILALVQVVLNQNYFRHENELFQQTDGLAMGASIIRSFLTEFGT
jgi:hypothetical protein